MRSSRQRDLILEIINNSKDHLSAEEIYHMAKREIANISLGTIYRNINQLVDHNMIIRIKTNEGIDRFDNIIIRHHHFICDCCHKIIDVHDLSVSVNAFDGNEINGYEIKLKGICKDCKGKEI